MNKDSPVIHNTEEVTFTDNDVICGRGRAIWKHPGNTVFRAFIRQHTDAYAEATSRTEKSNILMALLQQLKERNVRIFKRDEAGKWQQLGDKEVKHKVSS
jgi:hypothetical protein